MSQFPKLRIIPLGGVDEIGKNMTVIEYEDDILVVDCGSIFPDEDMLGIDLVIPDASYLEANKDRVRGYVFTHGHEDHIGATPYILQQVPAPIWGTRLTLALIDLKLREHRVNGIQMNAVVPRDEIKIGQFTVQFIHVSHGAFTTYSHQNGPPPLRVTTGALCGMPPSGASKSIQDWSQL